jgi:hypothetical protein
MMRGISESEMSVVDERSWRVVVDVGNPGLIETEEDVAGAGRVVRDLEPLTADSVVSHEGARAFAYVRDEGEAATTEDLVRDVLARAGLTASVVLTRWDEDELRWVLPNGSTPPRRRPRATQPKSRSEITVGNRTWARSGRRSSRGVRLFRRTIILALAAGGIVVYADAPGIGSYQLGSAMVFPAFVMILFWLRRLPSWLKWTGSVILALAGIVGYLLTGGPQWWFWGQVAVWPIVLMAFSRIRAEELARQPPWYGGPAQGPFGPP